ncbi:hypothetical protein V8E53_010933 [Lactarius tabidus]
MASSFRTLALIRRLYALGTFLQSRFKFLLFVLCRKLTSWLMTVRTTTRRLGYCKDVVVSRKPNSLGPKRPTIAASAFPASSSSDSSQLLQASVSRASIRLLSPDVGRFTSTLGRNSRQDYYAPESGTVTPEPGDCQIDMAQNISQMPLLPLRVASPQDDIALPIHQAQSQTDLTRAIPMDPTGISRYERHSPISRDKKITVIERLTTVFPHFQGQGVDLDRSFGIWTSATHPEGALYFYNPERVCPSFIDKWL